MIRASGGFQAVIAKVLKISEKNRNVSSKIVTITLKTTNSLGSDTIFMRISLSGENPIKYTDPDGNTTEIDELTGAVKNVLDDDSTVVIAYPYSKNGERLEGPGNYIGDTMFWDSFISPDTGNPVGIIYPNQSIDDKMAELFVTASRLGKTKTWMESVPGGEMDIKSQLPGHEGFSYHGFLYDGKYVSLREAGNLLAGMNAAQFGMEYSDFQKGAGALHVAGIGGVVLYETFGKTYGSAPYWGENYYQYRSSIRGYFSVKK
jgi:filamentous hemagglutinin